jgi:hypothetical protein
VKAGETTAWQSRWGVRLSKGHRRYLATIWLTRQVVFGALPFSCVNHERPHKFQTSTDPMRFEARRIQEGAAAHHLIERGG